MPPVAEAVAAPSMPPLQVTLESIAVDACKTVGSVIVTISVSLKPMLSVTVIEYMPATTPLMVDVVSPLLHK